jgi:hypothetical protein
VIEGILGWGMCVTLVCVSTIQAMRQGRAFSHACSSMGQAGSATWCGMHSMAVGLSSLTLLTLVSRVSNPVMGCQGSLSRVPMGAPLPTGCTSPPLDAVVLASQHEGTPESQGPGYRAQFQTLHNSRHRFVQQAGVERPAAAFQQVCWRVAGHIQHLDGIDCTATLAGCCTLTAPAHCELV